MKNGSRAYQPAAVVILSASSRLTPESDRSPLAIKPGLSRKWPNSSITAGHLHAAKCQQRLHTMKHE